VESMQPQQQRSLSWSGILAGAALAIGAGWTGELLGGWLALAGNVQGNAAVAAGLAMWLVFVCAGAGFGGWIAGRTASQGRGAGALHGAIVWGVSGAFGAATFAILGGNVPLVTGNTGAAMQAGFAYSFFGMVLALPLAVIGGMAATQPLRRARRILVKPPREDVEKARTRRSTEETPQLQTRTHHIEVETADGTRRADTYREGVSYPPGDGRPSIH
jgi:hypothetical protein